MAKRKIDVGLKKTIETYIAKISQYFEIDAVYLFGSSVKGGTHKDSDIDLAIVSSSVKDRIEDNGKLFALTWDIDTNIEPHLFRTEDFNRKDTIMVDEILRTGIQVYSM